MNSVCLKQVVHVNIANLVRSLTPSTTSHQGSRRNKNETFTVKQ